MCAQYTKPDVNTAKRLVKAIDIAKSIDGSFLKFIKLDKDTISLAVFSDPSFRSNPNLSPQLGYGILLTDGARKPNISNYSSINSRRVTRSVLSSKLYAAVHAFDSASTLKMTITEVCGKLVPLTLNTDSNSLYDGLVEINATTEKRLLINLRMFFESYEFRKLAIVIWIPSSQNPADNMTRDSLTPALQKLLDENLLVLRGGLSLNESRRCAGMDNVINV